MIGLFNMAPYAWLPFSCGLIVIVVGYVKLWKLRKSKYPETIGVFGIWLMGIIAFLLGIFGQVLNMINTFDSIAQAGDISPSLVAEGIKSSYKSTLVGLTVLIISLIIWGILNRTKQNRIHLNPVDKD
jgi:biopolymer transport protein ExbB